MTSVSPQSRGRESAERRFQRAVLEADVSIAHEVFTPDVVMYSTTGRLFGVPAMQAAALEFRALDELAGQMVISCAGNELVARFRVCGRQMKPFFGAPPNGELLEVHGIVSTLAEGEKLAELWKTCATHYGTKSKAPRPEPRAPFASHGRVAGLTRESNPIQGHALKGRHA